MKIKKIFGSLACAAPLLCMPLTLTSCSVYTNCLNGFKPNFKQIDKQTYTKEQGLEQWYTKGLSTNDYIKQELLWSHAETAKLVTEDQTGIEGYTYKSSFSSYQANVSYANMHKDNDGNIRVSFKVNTDIQSDDTYYYGDPKEKIGTGVTHYQVEWTCKDLRFDAVKETIKTTSGEDRPYWLLKPYVYDNVNNKLWYDKDHLFDDKEQVSFNARYIIEIYKNGVQQYGFEANEAALISQGREYEFMLYKLVGYFCCFWSYALDNCTYQE